MLALDHIAVAGETLAAATAHVAQAVSCELQPGGEHAVFHTHNTLLGLADGLYLEAIAINSDAPAPDRPRWFDLDRFTGSPRLTNWICRCADLDAALAALPDGFGSPVALARGDLRWRMAVPQSGILPFDNCAPALIEWQAAGHPATRLQPSGLRLKELQVHHPEARKLAALLAPHLNDARVQFKDAAPGLRATFSSADGAHLLT